MNTIGERLKEERLRNGWSQKDLARESKTNVDTISGIETGQHEPRPSTLRKLAKALDIEVRELFEEPALAGKAEAPRETGPPQVSREELAAQGIEVTDHEVSEVNYNIADFWRVIRGGKPVAYFPHDDVDPKRVGMLMHLVLDTPSIITPEAAGVIREGIRERLKA